MRTHHTHAGGMNLLLWGSDCAGHQVTVVCGKASSEQVAVCGATMNSLRSTISPTVAEFEGIVRGRSLSSLSDSS